MKNTLARGYIADWKQTSYTWEPLYLNCLRLTKMPTLPSNLQILFICGNSLTDLGARPLPIQLKEFHCENNTALASLGPRRLPSTLTVLSCGNCSLTTLGRLPSKLKILDCTSNPHLILSAPLPPRLRRLACACAPLCPLPLSLHSFAYYGSQPLPYALPPNLQLLRAASVHLFTDCTDSPPDTMVAIFLEEESIFSWNSDQTTDWKTAWARSAAQAHVRHKLRCRVFSTRLPLSALLFV